MNNVTDITNHVVDEVKAIDYQYFALETVSDIFCVLMGTYLVGHGVRKLVPFHSGYASSKKGFIFLANRWGIPQYPHLFRTFVGLVEVFALFHAGWRAVFHVAGPEVDFVRAALGPGVLAHPLQQRGVTESGFDLFFEGLRINRGEFENLHVERAGVVEVAVRSGDDRTAFVDDAGQQNVAPEAGAGAAGRAFGQIGGSGNFTHWIEHNLPMVAVKRAGRRPKRENGTERIRRDRADRNRRRFGVSLGG